MSSSHWQPPYQPKCPSCFGDSPGGLCPACRQTQERERRAAEWQPPGLGTPGGIDAPGGPFLPVPEQGPAYDPLGTPEPPGPAQPEGAPAESFEPLIPRDHGSPAPSPDPQADWQPQGAQPAPPAPPDVEPPRFEPPAPEPPIQGGDGSRPGPQVLRCPGCMGESPRGGLCPTCEQLLERQRREAGWQPASEIQVAIPEFGAGDPLPVPEVAVPTFSDEPAYIEMPSFDPTDEEIEEAVEGITETASGSGDPAVELRFTAPDLLHKAGMFTPEEAGLTKKAPRPIKEEELDPDRLESEFGMPAASQTGFQFFAENYGLEIDVRPTNPGAPRLLKGGALPKPDFLKSKTIDELDIMLGARLEDDAQVGFFKPTLPEQPPDMSESKWKELQSRFLQRDAEFWELSRTMTQLQRGTEKGQIRIDEAGVVHALERHGDAVVERPFTGDHDLYDIRWADGSPLSDAEYEVVIALMKAAGLIQHGAHVRWMSETPREGEKRSDRVMYETIKWLHVSGERSLIRFAPGSKPKKTGVKGS